ncbi:BTAD domain-containing putative transcriptional regulator [Nocardia sp. NPDC005978]|uniref:AfsR/SARP family transcriptional regulator n=1 Tax=Nocardia sp. NPDC005978 TaxID=3156725 RepID=UPI0033ADD274
MSSETSGSDGAGTARLAAAGATAPAVPSHTARAGESEPVLVGLLGEVALRRGGVLAPVPGARARLLVAALATHPGRSRSAHALIDEVWGEEPPRAPMNALHTQVSRLRALLPEGVLEIGPAGYRLVIAPEQVDLARAELYESRARQAHEDEDEAACLEWIAAARTLWRGEPGADLPPGPVAEELITLAGARAKALDALELSARAAVGDLDGALDLARRAAGADPFGEPAHATLMRLLAAAGRGNEALEVFAALRTRLGEQLGVDPGPAVTALNTAILRGEELPGPPGRAFGRPNQGAGQGYPKVVDSGTGAFDRLRGMTERAQRSEAGSESWDARQPANGEDTRGSEGAADTWRAAGPDRSGSAADSSPGSNAGNSERLGRAAAGRRGAGGDGSNRSDSVADARRGADDQRWPESAAGGRRGAGTGGEARISADADGSRWPESAGEQSDSSALRPLPGVPAAGRGSVQALRRVAAAQHAALSRESAEPAASAIGLRAAPNPLLGRAADLDALQRLLGVSRVTTVLGPGGTGKTRVANELGARVAHERTVALVELASVRADPGGAADTRAEIEAAIATTLGIGELGRDNGVLRLAPARDVRQRLREALSSRPMLLILDNCEHLIAAVAEVVADLVGASEQLTVLTTSRAPLEITAETVYPLPPLTIDAHGSPATDLFCARARAVRPSVRLDPEVVARLCHTLDGLPLAIELAAARARTMSVEEIESRLEHRFALLRSGDRSSPERHRTLHAVIEWSWNLLDGEQRTALRRLCRFPAGFTLAAAEAVIAGPEIPDVAAAVDGLVGQSLLTVLEPDDEIGVLRYRMLETVREFGEERLAEAGEADLVMDRMSCWARAFALDAVHGYTTGDQVRVVLTVAAEIDNLVAVLRYALDHRDIATGHAVFPVLSMLWVMRGAHMELIGWGPRMLALPLRTGALSTSEADLQMFGQLVLGLHLMYSSGGPREFAIVRNRIRRLRETGHHLSPMFEFLGELATVPIDARKLGRVLVSGVRSHDARTRTAALLFRANVRENAGDVAGSIRDAVHAFESGAREDIWGHAMVSQHLGSMYGQSARYAESVGYYREAVELLARLRAFEESVEIRSLLAVSLAGIGELAQARRELEPALAGVGVESAEEDAHIRPNHRRAAVTAGLAEIALAEGDIETGLRRYRQVLQLLAWPQGFITPGPGDIMTAAAVLDAHVLHGEVDRMRALAAQLIEVSLARLAHFPWDLPQIGAMSIALGSYLLAAGRDTGTALELLMLGPKVLARQDYPSMLWQRHVDLHRAAVGAETMDAAVRAAAGVARRGAAQRIMEIAVKINGTL